MVRVHEHEVRPSPLAPLADHNYIIPVSEQSCGVDVFVPLAASTRLARPVVPSHSGRLLPPYQGRFPSLRALRNRIVGVYFYYFIIFWWILFLVGPHPTSPSFTCLSPLNTLELSPSSLCHSLPRTEKSILSAKYRR